MHRFAKVIYILYPSLTLLLRTPRLEITFIEHGVKDLLAHRNVRCWIADGTTTTGAWMCRTFACCKSRLTTGPLAVSLIPYVKCGVSAVLYSEEAELAQSIMAYRQKRGLKSMSLWYHAQSTTHHRIILGRPTEMDTEVYRLCITHWPCEFLVGGYQSE